MNKFIEETHEYFIDGERVPGVTEILKSAGLYDEQYFTEEARNRGTYVHKACLYYLQDDLDDSSIREEYRGYIEAFKLCMSETDCKPIIEKCEVPLFAKLLKFGGTPDLPCMFNNRLSLWDIKTGIETAVTGVQILAYTKIMDGDWLFASRYGLYLKADGKYKLIPYTNRKDIHIFNAALTLYHWWQKEELL